MKGVLVRAPSGAVKSWVDLIPRPWSNDPFVVLVLVPEEAETFGRRSPDGEQQLTFMKLGGVEYGLQIIRPEIPKWSEQAYAFGRAGIKMAKPEYVGRLSGTPSELLMRDAHPVFFLRDNMSGQWMNARAFFRPEAALDKRKETWA